MDASVCECKMVFNSRSSLMMLVCLKL